MKSMKLTNDKKEQLTAKLLKYRFAEKESAAKQLRIDACALAEAVYNDGMGKDNLEKLKKVPPGWIPEANHIQVKFPGDSHYIWMFFNGADVLGHLNLNYRLRRFIIDDDKEVKHINKPVPASFQNKCFAKYDAKHPFTKTYTDLLNRVEDLNTQIVEAERAIRTALDSVKTTNQLLEKWPEVEPFLLEAYGEQKQVTALAIPTEKLNKMLELPKELAA